LLARLCHEQRCLLSDAPRREREDRPRGSSGQPASPKPLPGINLNLRAEASLNGTTEEPQPPRPKIRLAKQADGSGTTFMASTLISLSNLALPLRCLHFIRSVSLTPDAVLLANDIGSSDASRAPSRYQRGFADQVGGHDGAGGCFLVSHYSPASSQSM
jgi:hypothetical protein